MSRDRIGVVELVVRREIGDGEELWFVHGAHDGSGSVALQVRHGREKGTLVGGSIGIQSSQRKSAKGNHMIAIAIGTKSSKQKEIGLGPLGGDDLGRQTSGGRSMVWCSRRAGAGGVRRAGSGKEAAGSDSRGGGCCIGGSPWVSASSLAGSPWRR